jgi:hypothetical protein
MKIKVCPFCNSSAQTVREHRTWVILCDGCNAEGPRVPTRKEAITKWNCAIRTEDPDWIVNKRKAPRSLSEIDPCED